MAQEMGLHPRELVERQRQLLERFNLPIAAKGVNVDDILKGMSLDKKVQGGSKRWVMLEEVGRSVVRTDVPEELVEKTVRELVS